MNQAIVSTVHSSDTQALPLEGVRVLDFSQLMPGPWCTQALGDLGADVVKVERAGVPDPSRFNPPRYREETVYFHCVNRNKRSICLDLADAADRATAVRLIVLADVVVESFRPGVTAKLGIDYASAAALNPRLIYCSVTGFAADSPYAGVPGHDAALQGLAGLLHGGGEEPPPMPRIQAADYAAANYATIAILAAYIRRAHSGKGCFIEAPMYDSLMSWSSITSSSALARLAGHSGSPALESFGTNPRYSTYQTRDGKAVTVCLLEARTWARFCAHIGHPELVHVESAADRHTSHPGRTEAYRNAIFRFCAAHDRDDLILAMEAHDIPIAPIYTPDEALHSPVARAQRVIRFIDHPRDGPVPYFVDPLARAGLADPHRRPAPAVGEHSEEIVAELNLAWQDRASR